MSAMVDISIFSLLRPFYLIKIMQYLFPELVKLLLEDKLLRAAVDAGYLAIGFVVKSVIWFILK